MVAIRYKSLAPLSICMTSNQSFETFDTKIEHAIFNIYPKQILLFCYCVNVKHHERINIYRARLCVVRRTRLISFDFFVVDFLVVFFFLVELGTLVDF